MSIKETFINKNRIFIYLLIGTLIEILANLTAKPRIRQIKDSVSKINFGMKGVRYGK